MKINSLSGNSSARGGFTLVELVITLAVLTVLSLGVIPLVQTSVKREREQRLRETLRDMRTAIDEFHRDTIGMQCVGAGAGTGLPPSGGGTTPPVAGVGNQAMRPGTTYMDPRSKVVIADCTIFNVDNPDHYPPDLDTLVKGVKISPRGNTVVGGVNGPDPLKATDELEKKKVYLREVPVDPITGKAEWELRSNYDAPDATAWGGENVFDVRSKAKGTALNGEKYSDW